MPLRLLDLPRTPAGSTRPSSGEAWEKSVGEESSLSNLSYRAAKLNFIEAPLQPDAESSEPASLPRSLSLKGAVSLNLLDMIGVGPFITLPLIVAAMGGPQAMLGWVLGALIAVCDGLVWAELGAAMPAAGGTYHFLRRIYPGAIGRWLSFVFLFQLLLSAPLSIASGAIGLSQYATFFSPRLATPFAAKSFGHGAASHFQVAIGPMNLLALAAVALAIVLLYRRLTGVARLSMVLSAVVLGTIAWVLLTALFTPAAHFAAAIRPAPGAFQLSRSFFGGLASAMLLATYDYWGYYNVTFLGAEVRDPARTIPRAILLSIAICGVLYLALNLSVLAVLPWQSLLEGQSAETRRAVISTFMEVAYRPLVGVVWATRLAHLATVLVMVTAFASVFSLLLGYSRIPFAAAREGEFPKAFGRLHPTRELPHVSLLTLGFTAMVFCFFSLAEVIAALVVLRIMLQFLLQQVGILVLRRTQPELARPFRLWLYPLPPLVAIGGFLYILVARTHSAREIVPAVVVALAASAFFLLRERSALVTVGSSGASE